METAERNCKECGVILKGRSDQIYCSDYCRTAHHNHQNRDNSKEIRIVNNILKRNRRILIRLCNSGSTKIDKEVLLGLGFKFSFHTSTFTNKNRDTYFYCNDGGYLKLDENVFVIVKNSVTKF